MHDTSKKMQTLHHKLIMERSGEERLKMGCSMFDMSKRIIESSIKQSNPNISKKELRIQTFLRFYKNDFSDQELNKIIQHIIL